ncbi:hypothetical protein SAMN05421780_10259 [Flexibacter flexilis DSM 6793]|uniref:SpoIIAA-like n=1 Tax=Flexibacter flexilis DSM 6793 TaxID=927664 RepID=A0A1I1FA43_9BACT|nr:hypothetical protein [Flexibacter flexilis]SFB94588.1 hypothetical protein SAMN05421780_10259 [Flexibacter flexilis DSM 6793]
MFFENDFVRIDTSNPPFVEITVKPDLGLCTIEAFDEYSKHITQVSNAPHLRLVDLDMMFAANPTLLKPLADWVSKQAPVLRENCIACAFVVSSIHSKQAIDKLFTYQKAPYPYAIFGSKTEAQRWALAQWQASDKVLNY